METFVCSRVLLFRQLSFATYANSETHRPPNVLLFINFLDGRIADATAKSRTHSSLDVDEAAGPAKSTWPICSSQNLLFLPRWKTVRSENSLRCVCSQVATTARTHGAWHWEEEDGCVTGCRIFHRQKNLLRFLCWWDDIMFNIYFRFWTIIFFAYPARMKNRVSDWRWRRWHTSFCSIWYRWRRKEEQRSEITFSVVTTLAETNISGRFDDTSRPFYQISTL